MSGDEKENSNVHDEEQSHDVNDVSEAHINDVVATSTMSTHVVGIGVAVNEDSGEASDGGSSGTQPAEIAPAVPYSVFDGWERWAIIIMASMASFARRVAFVAESERSLLTIFIS